jgi:class 3 adenylate cyclase
MEAPRLERRLIAILSADVEGYSRHMERDEVATLATLSSHRVIVDDLVASHSGRITGTAGDSVLAEFQSVVDALDCAMKMQEAIAVASESQPTEHRLLFRIGINVGDVMVKDGDIFGDGVNIAARLGNTGRSRRNLRLAWRAGPRPQDGPVRFSGSRRAERQEHRPTDPGLPGAQCKRCAAGTISRVASCGDVELGRTARQRSGGI